MGKDVKVEVPVANMTIHTGDTETVTQQFAVVVVPMELLPKVQELIEKYEG